MSSNNFLNQISRNDTRYWIFKELFHVRIPFIQMLSVEELQFYGMPYSGDPVFDKQTPNELRDVMIPISEMVKYYHKGTQVYIVGEETPKIIYEHITNHLLAWKNQIQTQMNLANVPIEDLKLLDDFANSIYEHAKYHLTDEFIGSITGTMSEDLKQISRVSMLIKPINEPTTQKEKPTARNVRIAVSSAPLQPVVQEFIPDQREFPKREGFTKFLDSSERNTGMGSLNGDNAQQQKPSRASMMSEGGLSYQSLTQKARQWRS